jgi:hypothetical protein
MNILEITKIRNNPNNPRLIKDQNFKKLVQSLRDFPEMLQARPIVVDPENMVLGGNMRLKACIEAGIKEVPVYVATWDEVKQKQFIIKDNIGYGEWDWDILANEWDASELEQWGLDVWQPEEDAVKELKEEEYTFGANWFLSIEFENEKQTNEWYTKLMAEGLKVKIVQ